MNMTPMERRSRIYEIAEADEEYGQMLAEYEAAKDRFERFVNRLPRKLRNLLWSYPGMGYFLHHRMLTIICKNMIFPDEQ